MEEDELIYRRFLDGDEDSLRILMERYGNRLTLYIHGIIHDINDAEDLMIEAFSRMIVKRPKLVEHGFKSYLFKIGRNLALRYSSKRGSHLYFCLEDIDEELKTSLFVDSAVLINEKNRILHDCLDKLPPNYREALYLLYFEGMSYAQAAEIMKKTNKQIANLSYRGRQALKQILNQEGITDVQYE